MQTKEISMIERYRGCMILSAVGDIIGYKNAEWEFCYDSHQIHSEYNKLTNNKGINNLKLTSDWMYSDDTVMHLATCSALVHSPNLDIEFYQHLALEYKLCMNQMNDRGPGITCVNSCKQLDLQHPFNIPFNPRGGGCGASMRSACIGLRYHNVNTNNNNNNNNNNDNNNNNNNDNNDNDNDQLDLLIELSIESGRMTHHHPIGYLGALVAALFTSLALQQIPVELWMAHFINTKQKVINYLKKHRDSEINIQNLDVFYSKCEQFMNKRGLSKNINKIEKATFPSDYDIDSRDQWHRECSLGEWPGATGLDSVLIAYDCMLWANNWQQLVESAMLHGGDNDSTGAIAGAWWGACHGFYQVQQNNYIYIEGYHHINDLAIKLHTLYANIH